MWRWQRHGAADQARNVRQQRPNEAIRHVVWHAVRALDAAGPLISGLYDRNVVWRGSADPRANANNLRATTMRLCHL